MTYILTTNSGHEFQGNSLTEVVEKWNKAKHSLAHSYADVKIKSIITIREPKMIAGRTIEQWREFARTDNCLDQMVPSDLRQLLDLIDS